ncbi:ABC transporter permease [Pseudorhodoplanes sp.]|uniref:ABC transporter permease n=1 Tax=Pseudorhodoplanes sp. TaxID=1934341 RepID=UPI003D123B74
MLIVKKMLKDKPAMLGLAIVLLAIIIAVIGPYVAPYPQDASASHLMRRLRPPSAEHILGTDNLGRDILSRILLGTRGALGIALSVVGGAMLIGVPLGLIAGYSRGPLSSIIMRVTDVFLSLPQLILALALAQLIGASLRSAMIALTFTYWPFFARIVFNETRRLRASLFVDALQGIGANRMRILAYHILPNMMSSLIVRATLGLGFTILMAAVLGFLGMGAAPPSPDWGLMIAQSRVYLPDAWWYVTFPGLAILVMVLGFNLLGDGLRDILDPKLRRSR